MIWITKEQIIEFQEKLIRKTGGSFGLRDEGSLESCIYSPLQSFDGKEFYSSIIDKASRVSYLLVNNHPFIDGNKRIGALTLLYIFINIINLVYFLLNVLVLLASSISMYSLKYLNGYGKTVKLLYFTKATLIVFRSDSRMFWPLSRSTL